ncbi:MAG: hypothetical protein KIS62_12500 [Ramlibacter sp.]|nr:hypothetical protein [Ramlibacter sp.]MCW5650559.1 hypothetical protein [Ramlibacter sp.]
MSNTYWRAELGQAPWATAQHPLAAHAPAALQAAARRLYDVSQAGLQVVQVPFTPDAEVGASIQVATAQGGQITGRIATVEHLIEGALAITRLELESSG